MESAKVLSQSFRKIADLFDESYLPDAEHSLVAKAVGGAIEILDRDTADDEIAVREVAAEAVTQVVDTLARLDLRRRITVAVTNNGERPAVCVSYSAPAGPSICILISVISYQQLLRAAALALTIDAFRTALAIERKARNFDLDVLHDWDSLDRALTANERGATYAYCIASFAVNFVVMHELGHALRGHRPNSDFEKQAAELDADNYAMAEYLAWIKSGTLLPFALKSIVKSLPTTLTLALAAVGLTFLRPDFRIRRSVQDDVTTHPYDRLRFRAVMDQAVRVINSFGQPPKVVFRSIHALVALSKFIEGSPPADNEDARAAEAESERKYLAERQVDLVSVDILSSSTRLIDRAAPILLSTSIIAATF